MKRNLIHCSSILAELKAIEKALIEIIDESAIRRSLANRTSPKYGKKRQKYQEIMSTCFKDRISLDCRTHRHKGEYKGRRTSK